MAEGANKDTKKLDTRQLTGRNLAAAAHDGAKKNTTATDHAKVAGVKK